MRCFFTLFSIFLKQRLKSNAFRWSSVVLLLLFGSFAVLCPVSHPASAEFGLMYDPADSEISTACEPLLSSSDLKFIFYAPNELDLMQNDLLNGKLHCAYSVDTSTDTPITVYENEGSFLSPVSDELVFAAWFETQITSLTLSLAENLDSQKEQLILSEMQRLEIQGNPLSFELILNTSAVPTKNGNMSLAPLLYAVLIPLFLLCSAFSAMLLSKEENSVITLLRQTCATRRHLPQLAAVCAQSVLFAALLAMCELLLIIFNIDASYSIFARIVLICLLSFGAALMTYLLSHVRPNTFLLFAMVMWAVSSVIFSGAIVDPSVFGRLGTIRYISPSWALLRLMTILS